MDLIGRRPSARSMSRTAIAQARVFRRDQLEMPGLRDPVDGHGVAGGTHPPLIIGGKLGRYDPVGEPVDEMLTDAERRQAGTEVSA